MRLKWLMKTTCIFVLFSKVAGTGLNPSRNLASDEFLNGKHIVVGTLKNTPFISYKNISADGKIYDVSGFTSELVLYLSTKYNFKFEYVLSKQEAFGGLENGTWNGLVGMLIRGEVDLAATSLMITYSRGQVIDFTVQFFNDETPLMIPYPELDRKINGIAKPFQLEVWILIGISVFIFSLTLWKIIGLKLSSFGQLHKNISIPSWLQSFWFLIKLNNIVRMNDFTNFLKLPVKILVITWCLGTFFFMNAYSSTLTSYLMTPSYRSMADSIEDIAKIPRPVFMVYKFSAFDDTLLKAKTGVLSKIGDSLRKNPELRLNIRDRAAELVVKYKRSFTSNKAGLLAIIEQDMKETNQCRVYLTKKSWETGKIALGLPKGSPITQLYNYQINWLRDVGILDHWQRFYWPKLNRCSEPLTKKKAGRNLARLTLDNLSSAFLFLCCGLATSLFIFLIEVCCHINHTHTGKRVRKQNKKTTRKTEPLSHSNQ